MDGSGGAGRCQGVQTCRSDSGRVTGRGSRTCADPAPVGPGARRLRALLRALGQELVQVTLLGAVAPLPVAVNPKVVDAFGPTAPL
ncbi:hypothetical protein FHU34_12328 [Micromonospora taraxaci]|uniref:Uncharacterized protein n=1 Tax=Micromonospora taraxaci TaxID=1316803 RepID=A0A561VE48_9ACTN|nr:hypothetical protein FHU34_12328 [Micromonospora taraxaci]